MELVERAVAVFQTRGVFEGGGEFYEEGIIFSPEVFCYIEAVGCEHVEAFGDEFFVEPDLGDGVETFKDEVDSVGFEDVLRRGECFFIDPGFLAYPVEFFRVGYEVFVFDSVGVDEGGED